jgi:predicted acylesterase/phospholipase RssA
MPPRRIIADPTFQRAMKRLGSGNVRTLVRYLARFACERPEHGTPVNGTDVYLLRTRSHDGYPALRLFYTFDAYAVYLLNVERPTFVSRRPIVMTPVPIQLAIQGGGAKLTYLIAALEALQQLEREGVLRVTRIAGTSAGAIAGALYAARVDMHRVRDTFVAERHALLRAFPSAGATLRDAWRLFTRRPLWDAAPLRRILGRLLAPCETFRDFEIPLVVVAADLSNAQPVTYSRPDDPLLASIMDSAGIPFLFRAVPHDGEEYRVVVDGGVCDNLPCELLESSVAEGEVVGITFSVARDGAVLTTFPDYVRALVDTAINASVLRAQMQLGPNALVLRAPGTSFDFRRALDAASGAEYRETQLLAESWFRAYAARRAKVAAAEPSPRTFPEDTAASLRRMYERQQEPVLFEFLSVRMIVTAASESRGADNIRHEIVFRATTHPVHCYRILLTPASASDPRKTHCEAFDVDGDPIPFELVPVGRREYLLFFATPVAPDDPRAPVTLRVRDAVPEGLRLAATGRDELVVRASRADRPIARIEIVVHLPEDLQDTRIAAAPGSEGTRMSPPELLAYPAPAGYITLGWKGESIPPNTLFGCNLVRR